FFLNARLASASSSALSSTRRMTFSSLPIESSMYETFLCLAATHGLKREAECRSFAHDAFSADAPAVAIDDSLYRCQPDPSAGELLVRMQALESAKQLVRIGHVEAGPVIADKKLSRAILANRAELDPRAVAFGGEFPGIAQ